MTDTSGAANTPPVSIDPGVLGLVTDVFGATKPPAPPPPPDSSGKEDETFYQKTGDEFKKAVDTVNSVTKLVGNTISAAAGAVAGAGGQAQGALNQSRQGIQQENEALSRKAIIEGAARDKEVADNLTVATAEHTTPTQMVDRANRLSMLADNIQSENDDLRKRASTSIFDDPLTFIQNLFTTPFVKRKHDADLESFKEEAGILKEQQAQTSDAGKVNAGLDAAHGIEYTKAITDALAGQATQKQAAVTLEAAKYATSNAGVVASLSEAQLNTALKYQNSASNAMTEARENLVFDINAGIKSTRQARYQQQLDDVKATDTGNLIASAVMGRSVPISETELKTMPGNMKASFEDMKNASLNAAAAGHAMGIAISPAELPVGSTPYDASQNVKNLGIKMATPSQQATSNFILDTAATIAQQPAKPGMPQFRTLDPVTKKQIVNDAVLARFDHDYTAIPATGSPLSPAPMAKIVSIPLIASTDLGKAMSPLALNPLGPMDFDALNIQAQKLIDGGKSIPEVAAQLNLFGKQMSAQTNEIRGLSRYNLPLIGSSERPNFNVTVHDRVGNAYSIDLNNRAAIESSLTRQRINEKFAVESTNLRPFYANP